VIIVVEGIKRSRREEVDWGQLKWAVDKSGQFEGKPYSSTSDKSKKVAYASWTRGHGGDGKSRVWTQGLQPDSAPGHRGPTWTSDSTNTFIYGTVTLSPLFVPSVAVGQNKGAKAEMPKGQVYSLDTVTKPCKT
jgi:hypothetical protein